jgi:hypothetical protein
LSLVRLSSSISSWDILSRISLLTAYCWSSSVNLAFSATSHSLYSSWYSSCVFLLKADYSLGSGMGFVLTQVLVVAIGFVCLSSTVMTEGYLSLLKNS